MKITLPAPRLMPLTMLALAGLLCLKSVSMLRVFVPGGNSGAAQAAEPAPPAAPKSADDKPGEKLPAAAAGPVAAEKPVAAPAPAPPVSDSERALLLDLRKRRGELDSREAALVAREAMLSAAQTRLTTRVDEMGGLQKRLESLETARADRDEANWRSLVKLYETMKPKEAATIFNDLDPSVLLPVLDRMKEIKVAAVFAAMLPDRVRTATIELTKLRERANTIPPAATAGAGG